MRYPALTSDRMIVGCGAIVGPAAPGRPGGADPYEVADDEQAEGSPQQEDDQRRGDVVPAEVQDLADEGDGVLRREQRTDVAPVDGQQVASRSAGSGAAQDDEQEH